jgi:DNA-binding MarR family transcriptional regulator
MTKKLSLPTGTEGMVYAMLRASRQHKFTARELMALLLLPSNRAVVKGKVFVPSITDVAALMNIPKPSASRTVSWLTAEELVSNTRDPADTRRNLLHRTPAGDALVAAMVRAAEKSADGADDDTEGL